MSFRRRITALGLAVTAIAAGLSGIAHGAGQPAGANGIIMSRCEFTHRATDDPLVHPGMPGMSHSHDFWGNTAVDAASTPAALVAGTSTCKIADDHSGYWAPTLYADGVAVNAATMLAYYQRANPRVLRPLPTGLAMVAGDRDHVRWSCFAHGMATAKKLVPPKCAPDQKLGEGIIFPDCWNGKTLDSADHRSHMAYSDARGRCPRTHPTIVPALTMWVLYDMPAPSAHLTLASGELSSAHADFMNGWVPSTYATLHSYCLVEKRPCYKTMYRVLNVLHLPAHP